MFLTWVMLPVMVLVLVMVVIHNSVVCYLFANLMDSLSLVNHQLMVYDMQDMNSRKSEALSSCFQIIELDFTQLLCRRLPFGLLFWIKNRKMTLSIVVIFFRI